MKSSFWLAIGITLCLAAWMLSGHLTAQEPPNATASPAKQPTRALQVKVQTKTLQAQNVTREVTAQGQLEPLRSVQMRAETEGVIVDIKVDRGQRVEANAVCVQIAMDIRQAQLTEARALLRQRQKELASLQRLKKQGLQAENNLIVAQTDLASAKTAIALIQQDIKHTQIRAPFAGILNERLVEQGDFVQRGDVVAVLVDDAVLKVSVQMPQQHIHQLHVGQSAEAQLLNGDRLQGHISYISAVGDTDMHTFRVEVQIPHQDYRAAGSSATVRIPVETLKGHFISPASLALSDAGELGVKTVDADNRVEFHIVEILRTETQGTWVAGLPEEVQLITLGQGFVKAGEKVDSVPEV